MKFLFLLLLFFLSCNTKRKSPDLSNVSSSNIGSSIDSIGKKAALYFQADSLDKAMECFREQSRLSDSSGDKKKYAIALNNIGLIFSERSVYDSAIMYYDQAANLFTSIHDSIKLSQCYIDAGIAYKNLGSFEKAFSTTLDAVRIMEKYKASADLGTAYTTLGNTLKDLHRPQEALAWHQKAIQIRTMLKDSAGVAASLNNIGNVYKSELQFQQALPYYLQSLSIKERLGAQKSKITTIDNIAETYLGLRQFELAERYEKTALAGRNEKKDPDGWMLSTDRLARIYVAQRRLKDALVLARHISDSFHTPNYQRQQLENTLLLKDIYIGSRDYSRAINEADKAIALKDSLFRNDMSAAISRMNVQFQTAEQQKKLELAGKNAVIQQQEINKQRTFMILLCSIIFLLMVVVYLLYVSNRIRKKARERTELLMTELNHRTKNNLQLISGIINLQTAMTNDENILALIKATRSRIDSIGMVHHLLYQKEYNGEMDMQKFIAGLTANIEKAFRDQHSRQRVDLKIERISLHTDQAIPVGLIVNELVTNLYKYGHAAKDFLTVQVQLEQEKGKINLCIRDDGQSWQAPAVSAGLGLKIVDMLVQQLKATVTINRANTENIFCINFNRL